MKLRSLHRSFIFFERWSFLHPWRVLVFFALCLGLAFTQIPNIRGVVSIYELLPDSFPSLSDLKKTDHDFNEGRYLTLALRPTGAWTQESLCAIRAWISKEALTNVHVAKAFSAFDLRKTAGDETHLFYPRLIPLACETLSKAEFDLSFLEKTPWTGFVFGSDLKTILVQIHFLDSVVDPRFRAFSMPVLADVLNRWSHDVADPMHIQTRVLGNAPYEAYMAQGNQEFFRVHVLLVFVFLIFFRIFMGTWRAGFLYLGGLLVTLILLLGVMGATGGSLDILSNALFIMVAVASLQDFIYPSFERMEHKTKARRAFQRLMLPGFFTTLTTVVGFGALGISSLPMVRDFGLYAAFGAGVEWVVTFFLLPLVIQHFRFFADWVSLERAWGFRKARGLKLLSHLRIFRFHYVVVAVIALPVGLHFYDEPKIIFPMSHQFRQDTESFVQEFGWEYTADLVFPNGVGDRSDVVAALQKNPSVLRVDSADEAFRWLLEGSPPGMGDLVKREFFQLLRPERYFGNSGSERLQLFLRTSEISEVSSLRRMLTDLCRGDCYLSGAVVTYGEFVQHLAQTLFESLLVSLVLVSLILWGLAFARGYERPWLLIYSSLWGPGILLILIMVFRVPMNMMTSMTASVVLGLTGDNAIEFIFARRKMDLFIGLERRFSGALVTCLMMAGSSLVFLYSPFDPPRALGVLFSLGLVFSFVGDYFVLRYLAEK